VNNSPNFLRISPQYSIPGVPSAGIQVFVALLEVAPQFQFDGCLPQGFFFVKPGEVKETSLASTTFPSGSELITMESGI